MEVLDVYWFSNRNGCVGVAKTMDQYEGLAYYISAVEGLNVESDTKYIMEWGARFPKEAGDVLFGDDPLRNGNAVQMPMNEDQARLMYILGGRYLGILKDNVKDNE